MRTLWGPCPNAILRGRCLTSVTEVCGCYPLYGGRSLLPRGIRKLRGSWYHIYFQIFFYLILSVSVVWSFFEESPYSGSVSHSEFDTIRRFVFKKILPIATIMQFLVVNGGWADFPCRQGLAECGATWVDFLIESESESFF